MHVLQYPYIFTVFSPMQHVVCLQSPVNKCVVLMPKKEPAVKLMQH